MTRGWNAALALSFSLISLVISADNRDPRSA
jgi:hypothetical protein